MAACHNNSLAVRSFTPPGLLFQLTVCPGDIMTRKYFFFYRERMQNRGVQNF